MERGRSGAERSLGWPLWRVRQDLEEGLQGIFHGAIANLAEGDDRNRWDSVEDPGKVVVSGYPNGVMPTTFGKSLSKGEIASLVQLLATKGGT